MDFMTSPIQYKQGVEKKKREFIKKKEESCSSIMSKIYDERGRELNKYKEKEPTTFGHYMTFMCVLGMILFAVICIVGCAVDTASGGNGSIGLGVVVAPIEGGLAGGCLGLVIAPIYWPISRSANKRRNAINREKRGEIEKTYDKRIAKIQKEISKEIDAFTNKCDKEFAEYKEKYEQAAIKRGVDYTNSELGKEIINWLTSGFARTIRAANRATYIKNIFVPFDFKVYRDKIDCNIGTYSFKEHRCEEINSIFERTALAKAIASSIQLNISMEMEKDISGTEYRLDIMFDYGTTKKTKAFDEKLDDVSAILTYSAVNGNYVPEKKW